MNEWDYREYSDDEVLTILAAHQDLLGTQCAGTVVDYLDIGPRRLRPWSCLATDFRRVSLAQLREVHAITAEQDLRFRNGYRQALAEGRLQDYCIRQGHALGDAADTRRSSFGLAIGHSIGICPWTDHGLLSTWSSTKTRAVIILGHDWYPIVPAFEDGPHPLDSPLYKRGLHALRDQPANKHAQRYVNAAPSAVYGEDAVMLFLNLVPEYRPPATPVKGKWLTNYKPYLPGLKAVVEAVARRYGADKVKLVSWGAPTWEVVRPMFPAFAKTGVMAMSRNRQGSLFSFGTGEHEVDYLPLAHPSYDANFRNVERWRHLQHVELGYRKLGLGPAGPP